MARYVDFSVLDEYDDALEFREKNLRLLQQCREIALKRMSEILTASGYQQVEVCNRLNMSRSDVSYVYSGKRIPPLSKLGALCHDFLHLSCNELLFGEDIPLHLNSSLNHIADALEKMKAPQARKLLAKLSSRYAQYIDIGIGFEHLVTAERVRELAEENAASPYNLFTPRRISAISTRSSLSRAYKDLGSLLEEKRIPQVTTVMDVANMSGIPVDYFLVDNYIDMLPEVQYKKGENWTTINDPTTLAILRIYLRVPEEEKVPLFLEVVSNIVPYNA